MVIGIGAIAGSIGWTMFGLSNAPGTLALSGSPPPEVLRIRYCAFDLSKQAKLPSARARRGLAISESGSPVASARSPTQPAPNRPVRIASRRVISPRGFIDFLLDIGGS